MVKKEKDWNGDTNAFKAAIDLAYPAIPKGLSTMPAYAGLRVAPFLNTFNRKAWGEANGATAWGAYADVL